MNSYNKQALDIIAKEQGFIRDNLEKGDTQLFP